MWFHKKPYPLCLSVLCPLLLFLHLNNPFLFSYLHIFLSIPQLQIMLYWNLSGRENPHPIIAEYDPALPKHAQFLKDNCIASSCLARLHLHDKKCRLSLSLLRSFSIFVPTTPRSYF
ncbi:hypothetical protein DL95DRAFT_164944 [Leptodontidium sp. 2 PMI_412]|nr:hypothetical protein DL95DRAFT_164944 [Leptodontidium sp. 2 PMI_412]